MNKGREYNGTWHILRYALPFIWQTIFMPQVHAETVWCKTLKMGCPTPESEAETNDKNYRFCQKRANQAYIQGLQEATSDPEVWRSQGLTSATDYAKLREKLRMTGCMKHKSKYPNSQY
jgi:hypothetical protein